MLTVASDRGQESLRQLVLSGGMARPRALRVLNSIAADRPWLSKRDYIEAMAALSACFPTEMQKKTYMQGRSMVQVLWSATSADRLAWMFNGLIVRWLTKESFS